jgi:hypothetical protein
VKDGASCQRGCIEPTLSIETTVVESLCSLMNVRDERDQTNYEIRKSSSFFPDLSCGLSQRGFHELTKSQWDFSDFDILEIPSGRGGACSAALYSDQRKSALVLLSDDYANFIAAQGPFSDAFALSWRRFLGGIMRVCITIHNPRAVAVEPKNCTYSRRFHSWHCMVIPLAISLQVNHDEDRRKFLASCGRLP